MAVHKLYACYIFLISLFMLILIIRSVHIHIQHSDMNVVWNSFSSRKCVSENVKNSPLIFPVEPLIVSRPVIMLSISLQAEIMLKSETYFFDTDANALLHYLFVN